MCRLLGLFSDKPVDLEFSLERFKEFASRNPDGWGIGWYEEEKPKIFKEGMSVLNSTKFPTLSKEVRSKIIITHVRKRTKGESSEKNSHPFQYRKWIFAHNGSVDKEYLLSQLKEEYRNNLKGETDSEVYFYYLLQYIEENNEQVEGIKKAINKIMGSRYTGLNFLLSDGNSLYAFRYSRNSKDYYSLYKLKRDPSNPDSIEYISKETKALIRSKSMKGEKVVLVCSEKLTEDENWEEINNGCLLIINDNLIIDEVIIK